MRAGAYAALDGVTYRAKNVRGPSILLLAPLSDPQPPGFERDNHRRWSRRVDRSQFTRTFVVKTTAVWKGQQVTVRSVLGDRATIEFGSQDASRWPELTHHKHGLMTGTVPVDSLSDVTEEVIEIPL